jgi:hypothetical protein
MFTIAHQSAISISFDTQEGVRHPYRAAATVIAGGKSVAVENHLIVCEPKKKTQAMCKELMRQLKTTAVNEFLDERIRCRHLTVGAVAAIPFQF